MGCLIQNKDHLQHLTIRGENFYSENRDEFCRVLESLTCLQTLRIEYSTSDDDDDDSDMVGPSISCLKELETEFHCEIANSIIGIIKNAPQLRKLTIQNEFGEEYSLEFLDRLDDISLGSVEELRIADILQPYRCNMAIADKEVKHLLRMKSLKLLELSENLAYYQLQWLILGLPKLEDVVIPELVGSDGNLGFLQFFMEEQKRWIRVNGKRYGGP